MPDRNKTVRTATRFVVLLGMKTMIYVTFISLFFALMVFLGGFSWAISAIILWGIGMGAQESVLKAAAAELIPAYKRGKAFGAFNAGFGISWFLGSVTLGYLYDFSILWLVIFSVSMQANCYYHFLATFISFKK